MVDVVDHKGHHHQECKSHHDHVHDSSVSSVSIVSEGTLDLDEVKYQRNIHLPQCIDD